MFLNTIQPAEGATHAKRRVGRGIGSGLGITFGRSHKDKRSRYGSFNQVGCEGGTKTKHRPLYKRVSKSFVAAANADVLLR